MLNQFLKDKLKNLLSVKSEDLKDAAERIFQNSSNTKTTIIGDKSLKKYAQNKAKKTRNIFCVLFIFYFLNGYLSLKNFVLSNYNCKR